MRHQDLMDRINKSFANTQEPCNDRKELGKTWRDADRRTGFRRYELKMPVKKCISFVKRFFKKERRQ
jgi:transcription initiation factor TFIIIB Brf1 subunit/transcription initiation factor TFIIB